VIKTKEDRIMGGFTNIPWKSIGPAEYSQAKSFLFTDREDKGGIIRFGSMKGKGEVKHGNDVHVNFGTSLTITGNYGSTNL